ncbi:MAG: hypothetical protein WA948_10420 [Pontixanthobacter sp.]
MRSFAAWPAPLPGGGTAQETALVFDQRRGPRLLVLPALFDEANKMRRQTVEVMHRLDLSGIDSVLPDLPGTNDSLEELREQTLANWKMGAKIAFDHFEATHVLTIRHGALIVPPDTPDWRYSPKKGKSLLRHLLRARAIAAKEAGIEETTAAIEAQARQHGVDLTGWRIGAALFDDLMNAEPSTNGQSFDIAQSDLGGAGLWLRAEPGEEPEQADTLAAIISMGMLEP